MGRSVVWLMLVVMPVVAACQREAAVRDPEFLIAPGGGIGSIRIGMSVKDATRVLGPPKSTRRGTGDETFYAWFDATDPTAQGLYVVALGDQVTRAGAHHAPRYVTPVGLHTGVDEQQVRSAMGEPSRVASYGPEAHGLVYNNVGIGFTIIDAPAARGYHTVVEIEVFGPQQWKWGGTVGGERSSGPAAPGGHHDGGAG